MNGKANGVSSAMDPSFVPYRIASAYLIEKLEECGMQLPTVGIICGSGLSELASALEGKTLTVKYSDIPGFPAHCTVAGHKVRNTLMREKESPRRCHHGIPLIS